MRIQREIYTHIFRWTIYGIDMYVYADIMYDFKTRLAPSHTAKLQYSIHERETEWWGSKVRGGGMGEGPEHAGLSILGHASAP